MKTLSSMTLAALLSIGTTVVHADHYAEGFMAAHEGNYAKALPVFQQEAEAGDARAQFNLALMYHGGIVVKFDEAKAVYWYTQAAHNGHRTAQEYLAVGYQEGWFGLQRDYQKAGFWYEQLDNNSSVQLSLR